MKTAFKVLLPLLAILFALSTCKKQEPNKPSCDGIAATLQIEPDSGFSDTIVVVKMQNGTDPYTYLWSDGETKDNAPYHKENAYSVTVTDDNDCTASAYLAASACEATIMDEDSNVYHVVRIGNQCWTVENLHTTKFRDGSPIDEMEDSIQWHNNSGTKEPAWCYPGGNQAYLANYGRLYNYYAVNSPHGLCPVGWHVPTEADWGILFAYLGGLNVAGGHLKATSTLWNAPNTGADNSSGFGALPAGLRFESGSFANLTFHGLFWSSTEIGTNVARYFIMKYDDALVTPDQCVESLGASVRLVHD